MVKVAVIRSIYLPISETFIYSELVNLKKFKPILCTKRIINLRDFPYKHIYSYQSSKELIEILRKRKVKLIHARFGTIGVEMLPIKKKLGIPLITSFHGSDLPTNKRREKKYKGKLKQLFRTGEAFTVVSENMKKVLVRHGCPDNKIYVHRSGIDPGKFKWKKRKRLEHGIITILTVGRLVEKKGMKYVIDAFYKIVKDYPHVRLRIAGDGPLRENLESRVKKRGIGDKVTFLGRLSHKRVSEEMHNAHIFVLASTTAKDGNQEGIPNVLKEAMASGLPVVSTRHAGIPELVQHGKSGYLVKERDQKSLANYMKKLISQPDSWAAMGKYGTKTVDKRFNSEKQVRHLEDIYRNIIKAKKEFKKKRKEHRKKMIRRYIPGRRTPIRRKPAHSNKQRRKWS